MHALRVWLGEVLDAGIGPLEPASTDASFRRYFRVRAGGDSFIVMDAPPGQEVPGRYVRIARVLRDAGLEAPEVFAADLVHGFLLLSDLGTTPYLSVLTEDTAERLYADALDALWVMQTRVSAAGLAQYDRARLRAEMELFPEWFLGTHLGLRLGAAQRSVLDSAFERLCRAAAEQPRVFVHRDYHSRNLMVLDGRSPGILDFQDAVCGPVTYDLLSLLRDVYVRWAPERVERWASAYRERLIGGGVLGPDDGERFLRWFDLMGVQRHLKVAGIFARLYHRDGKPAYLADIPLTLTYLWEECAGYPELAPLVELLAELDVRDRLEERNARVSHS
jgi:aminoglycoside/choline kinase family phosphotransferase